MTNKPFSAFKMMAEKIVTLHQQAVTELAPQVQDIIASNSQDAARIEQTLDLLLDSACTPNGLELFKTLCSYYWEINPENTATYVSAYREIWDANV